MVDELVAVQENDTVVVNALEMNKAPSLWHIWKDYAVPAIAVFIERSDTGRRILPCGGIDIRREHRSLLIRRSGCPLPRV